MPGRRRPVTTLAQAARFVDGTGLALLFPADRVALPSLWEAVAGPDEVPFADGMGPAESLVWTWKDELPRAGLAWYGKLLYKRASLLSPTLLNALYPGAGEPDDHRALALPDDAHRIAEACSAARCPPPRCARSSATGAGTTGRSRRCRRTCWSPRPASASSGPAGRRWSWT